MKFFCLFLLTVFLAACGSTSTLSGEYRDVGGKSTFVFTSDGKVHTKSPLGRDIETTYTVAENKVRFKFPDGLPMEFTINSDGSLSSPWGNGFRKASA